MYRVYFEKKTLFKFLINASSGLFVSKTDIRYSLNNYDYENLSMQCTNICFSFKN